MNEQMVACFRDYFGADPESLPSFWMAWSRAWNFGRGEMAWQVTKTIDDETAEGIGEGSQAIISIIQETAVPI